MTRKIDFEEFGILKEQLDPDEDLSLFYEYENNDKEIIIYKIDNVMEECYKLDTNNVPANYRLLPISKIIPDYVSAEPKRQENSRVFWDQIQAKLSHVLRKAAEKAFKQNLISKVKRDRYYVSSSFFYKF